MALLISGCVLSLYKQVKPAARASATNSGSHYPRVERWAWPKLHYESRELSLSQIMAKELVAVHMVTRVFSNLTFAPQENEQNMAHRHGQNGKILTTCQLEVMAQKKKEEI